MTERNKMSAGKKSEREREKNKPGADKEQLYATL